MSATDKSQLARARQLGSSVTPATDHNSCNIDTCLTLGFTSNGHVTYVALTATSYFERGNPSAIVADTTCGGCYFYWESNNFPYPPPPPTYMGQGADINQWVPIPTRVCLVWVGSGAPLGGPCIKVT